MGRRHRRERSGKLDRCCGSTVTSAATAALLNAERRKQTLLPLVREPPGSWPAHVDGDGDAMLSWRGQPEAPDATLESVLLSVLQFVSGGLHAFGRMSNFDISPNPMMRQPTSPTCWQVEPTHIEFPVLTSRPPHPNCLNTLGRGQECLAALPSEHAEGACSSEGSVRLLARGAA